MIKRIAKFALLSLSIASTHIFAANCADITDEVAGINFDCTCDNRSADQCKKNSLTICRNEGGGRIHIVGDEDINCTCTGSPLTQPDQVCSATRN